MILAGTQVGTIGGSQTKCADVVYNPASGDDTAPTTIVLSTTTSGAHIFYTINASSTPPNPTHSGDNATGTTIRIGNNSGAVDIPAGRFFKALAYKSGLLDSNITSATYASGGGGGM